jgi:inner membrane protein
MLLRTHFVFNLFVFLLLIKTGIFGFVFNWWFLLFFLLATCLPDIDIAGSFISNKTKPLSNFIHIFTKHREEFHSLLFAGIFSVIIFLLSKNIAFAEIFFLFYFLHLFLDSITKAGIKWFWPMDFIIRGKIKTYGFLEAIMFFIFSLACIFLILVFLI